MKNKIIAISVLLASLFATTAQAAPDCVGTPKPFFTQVNEIQWKWNDSMKAYEYLICGDAKTPGKPFKQMLKFGANYVGVRHNHPVDRVVMLISGKWTSTTYDGVNGSPVDHPLINAGDNYYESENYDHSFVVGPEGALIVVDGWTGPNKRNEPNYKHED